MNIKQKVFPFCFFNPLTANDELSRHENLTFLWTWTLRWVPRSFATDASLCNTLSSNKLFLKTGKILALKGLNYPKEWKLWFFFSQFSYILMLYVNAVIIKSLPVVTRHMICILICGRCDIECIVWFFTL